MKAKQPTEHKAGDVVKPRSKALRKAGVEIIYRPVADLIPNEKNPRKASPEAIANLAESIKGNPGYFEMRPVIVSDRTGKLVIIDGEQRTKAAKLLGWDVVPTILKSGLTEAEEDEILIKGNTHAGTWDEKKLERCGKDVLKGWNVPIKEVKMTEQLSGLEYNPIYYEPQEKPELSLLDCIDFDKFNAKIEVIENARLPRKTKDVLKWFAYRFIKIDFESVANYYSFNATNAEKEVIERLRLVLIDGGGGRRIHK